MTSSTTWLYDSVDLSTFGAITLLDDYLDMASRRGGNQQIPRKHGTIFVPKFYDETEIAMGIAMKYGNAELLEAAIDTLKTMCSSRVERVLSNTRADGSIRTAMAAVEGKLQTKRESHNFARVVITFKLAHPFFRGNVLVDEEVTVDASPVDLIVDNAGTVEECNPTLTLTGPLLNTTITNPANGCVLTYTGTIASPRVVTIGEVNGEFVAITDLGANVIGNISHVGSESLMVLEPGSNTLSITDGTHTTGKVRVQFYPPFL
jgi:phage-related protein